jgi:hypothetical protein
MFASLKLEELVGFLDLVMTLRKHLMYPPLKRSELPVLCTRASLSPWPSCGLWCGVDKNDLWKKRFISVFIRQEMLGH